MQSVAGWTGWSRRWNRAGFANRARSAFTSPSCGITKSSIRLSSRWRHSGKPALNSHTSLLLRRQNWLEFALPLAVEVLVEVYGIEIDLGTAIWNINL